MLEWQSDELGLGRHQWAVGGRAATLRRRFCRRRKVLWLKEAVEVVEMVVMRRIGTQAGGLHPKMHAQSTARWTMAMQTVRAARP